MILLVDKVQPNNLGGITSDLKKVKFNLGVLNVNINDLLSILPDNIIVPTTMFSAGKFIVVLQYERDFSKATMNFINSEIDLNSNFDLFADTMTPKSVAGFHKLQQQIKASASLPFYELTDADLPQ